MTLTLKLLEKHRVPNTVMFDLVRRFGKNADAHVVINEYMNVAETNRGATQLVALQALHWLCLIPEFRTLLFSVYVNPAWNDAGLLRASILTNDEEFVTFLLSQKHKLTALQLRRNSKLAFDKRFFSIGAVLENAATRHTKSTRSIQHV